MEVKHTPGKWYVKSRDKNNLQIDSDKNESPYVLATMVKGEFFDAITTEQLKANADRIVQCVNNYDELVKAVKMCINYVGSVANESEPALKAWEFSKELLNKLGE